MASEPNTALQIYAAIFIVIWLFIAKIIFFDLIVAVLVEGFEVAETMRLIKEPGHVSRMRGLIVSGYHKLHRLSVSFEEHHHAADESSKIVINEMPEPTQQKSTLPDIDIMSADQMLFYALTEFSDDKFEQKLKRTSNLQSQLHFSLSIFGPSSSFRRLCSRVKDHRLFQSLIYISIFVSCVIVLLTPPAEDVPSLKSPMSLQSRSAMDLLLTLVFTVELCLCVVSQVQNCDDLSLC